MNKGREREEGGEDGEVSNEDICVIIKEWVVRRIDR